MTGSCRALLHPQQLARLAVTVPGVRWPRAFRDMVVQGQARHAPAMAADRDGSPEQVLTGLRAFVAPRLRLRTVLRQDRLMTLTEVAVDAKGRCGALSTMLLRVPAPTARGGVRLQPVGSVELAAAPAASAPALALGHLPGTEPARTTMSTALQHVPPSGSRPARTVLLRGWGPALVRPVVDAWAQDARGWLRPAPAEDGTTTWRRVDAARYAGELSQLLREPVACADASCSGKDASCPGAGIHCGEARE